MILKRQKLGAFKLTSEIGADGVELDMGGLGQRETFDNKLADPAVRRQFLDEAKRYNLEICSIAMSGFYAQSFPTRPGVDRMAQDTIDTMVALGVKTAFLPLGVQGDLVLHPELRPAVVKRLRDAGRRAEKAGVVIGIETACDATNEAKLLDEIDSPAIKAISTSPTPCKTAAISTPSCARSGRNTSVRSTPAIRTAYGSRTTRRSTCPGSSVRSTTWAGAAGS